MIRFLVKKCIRNADDVGNKDVRAAYGVLAGVLGIFCNAFLFVLKLVIGALMNSIAITSDAFNNLSDMGTSLVALFGAKLSNRRADKEHPFGHGRFEYVAALIVAMIIVVVGVELFRGALDKVLNPTPVVFSWIPMAILAASMLVKVWMFSYNRYLGKRISSNVLKAASTDSLNDVISTAAIIVGTAIGAHVNAPVDGAIGIAVSVLVIIAGIRIAKDTVGVLLGNPPAPETVEEISSIILRTEGIVGVHDLIVHDYGPGRSMASVHAEVPDDSDMVHVHEIIDALELKIEDELGIHMVIHMDPISVNNERVSEMRQQVTALVLAENPSFSIHDFRITDGEDRINLIFDLVVPFELSQAETDESLKRIEEGIRALDGRFRSVIKVDRAY